MASWSHYSRVGLDCRRRGDRGSIPVGCTEVSKNNEYSSENSVFKEGCFPVLESLKTSPIQVMPKFVPLGTPSKQREDSGTTATSITTTTPPRSFVFGQNLHERIAGDAVTGESTDCNAPPTEESTSTNNVTINKSAVATTNGTSEMLFTSVIKMDSTCDSGGERSGKSLSEAAREYEEARAVKRKYDQVAVVTGEEGEHNVLQCSWQHLEVPGSIPSAYRFSLKYRLWNRINSDLGKLRLTAGVFVVLFT
uniref:Uncharacterized protein n=1 Tax=Timema tahoe TaxID=61484 RepID=A0A7R9IMN5_9NEOP|nr:unnamed protein product [Timema tahoe]